MKSRKIFERSYLGWTLACAVFFCTAGAIASQAQTFQNLFNFDGTNGGNVISTLVQGANGNFYGTTSAGGLYGMLGCSPCAFGGTIFEITPAGSLTTLYNFCAQTNCSDGSYPNAPLVQTTTGTFWGITALGGAKGYGTIFKISSLGTRVTVHSFANTDGANPASLLLASDGNFYGTTSGGGSGGVGTFFKITPAGVLTTLHTFCQKRNCSDGGGPGGLVQARNGSFYGISSTGAGTNQIVKVTTGGKSTVLYTMGVLDGCYPASPLVQGNDGNLYGTASSCGENNGGTFFKITPGGTFTVLHSFCIGCSEGRGPSGGFVQALDGNFYGTTDGGLGDEDCTVFTMTPGGTLTTLYTFDSQLEIDPSGLMQATNGTFYGATYFGGPENVGTIFSLSTGLGPFAQTLPTSGKVGATVVILGNNLTGATSVSFHGKAAAFTVVNDTEIKASVPAGASSGTVTVSTPTGVLSSNVPFGVSP